MTPDTHGYQRRTSVLVVSSAITTALTLFAVFRFTAELLSLNWIGAWSLIQGLLLVARVSDSGAGANISRVIAVRVKDGVQVDLRNLSVASLLVASLPSVLFAVVAAPIIGIYVALHFGEDLSRGVIWTLVWLALLNAVISAISNILLAICEGMFELNYKSVTVIASNVAGLLATVPLISAAGPAGIALVYVVMSTTQLLLAAIRIRYLVKGEPPCNLIVVSEHVRLLWPENLHLSGIALIRLSFEPATKLMLSFFAPLSLIAQFELALRVTTQIRVVIQSALQPLLVVGARAGDSVDSMLHASFLRNDRVLSTLAVGAVIVQVLAAPAIQWLGLGTHEYSFILFFAILAVGNALNIIGLSGYYWQLTSGSLVRLVQIQGVMAGVNVLLGFIGVALASAPSVVAAYAAAFAFGGLATRAFLPGISILCRLLSPMMVVLGGGISSGLIILAQPSSLIGVASFLGAAAFTGCACAQFLYRTIRRVD